MVKWIQSYLSYPPFKLCLQDKKNNNSVSIWNSDLIASVSAYKIVTVFAMNIIIKHLNLNISLRM